MKTAYFLGGLVLMGTISCGDKNDSGASFSVKNSLDYERSNETVTLELHKFGNTLPVLSDNQAYAVWNSQTQVAEVSQVVDVDRDGQADVLLFQPKIPANGELNFQVKAMDNAKDKDATPTCFSRFVPERTDDYAWENDRVAFRTYGPTAQKMVEDGVVGGTLSSGMDAWLKKVTYPIIDKWYEKELSGAGSYHEDTGEGLDNFHVGVSRGVGGIAYKQDSTYYISKNFVSWNAFTTGLSVPVLCLPMPLGVQKELPFRKRNTSAWIAGVI